MTLSPPLGIYVHWPYCSRICPYCDFNVFRDRGRAEEGAALVAAIVRDLQAYRALTGPRRLVSVFFGGGTPSLMSPAQVGSVLDAATGLWSPEAALEVSLEANPTDGEAERFRAIASAGVTRLSLGVQALDDDALRFLGRNHGAAEGRRAAEAARSAFPRLSVDLIYARPAQTAHAWASELAEVIRLGAEHVSPYQLTVEPGTAFGRAARRGTLTPADPELAADLYDVTQDVLGAAGYEAYEVSNHARGEAARSRHNLVYWRGEDYVGVGPGAHGRLTLDGVRHATVAPSHPADYIAAAGAPVLEPLAPLEVAEERLLMGLRITEGVALSEIPGLPLARAADLADAGLLVLDDRIRATASGRLLLDRITTELIV